MTKDRKPRKKSKPPSKNSSLAAPLLAHQADNLDLLHAVVELLPEVNLPSAAMTKRLAVLEDRFGKAVFAELLFLLTHLRFSNNEAHEHWQRILEIRDAMNQKLGSSVDVRVALVNYFVDVSKKLESPKIIELKLFEQTQSSVYRDELTGLYNYRYLRELLPKEILRVERYDSAVAVIMFDIDDFKFYNDRNGHETGNQALEQIARILQGCVRDTDAAIRYGGEEFILMLPSTTKKGAANVAERGRRDIENHDFPFAEFQPGKRITASVGVAVYPADADNAEDLIRNADRAMYTAKSRGKNQVALFAESERTHSRLKATINGEYCLISTEFQPLTTLNISEGGILFITNQKLPLEAMLDIKLSVDNEKPILFTGRVVRVEESDCGGFRAAIRIMHINDVQRRRLNKSLKIL